MDPVAAYLEYLREMSRKVAYRGTFLNVLHRKSVRSPERYLNWDSAKPEGDMQRYLAAVDQDVRGQDGRALFIGIGILVGRLAFDGKANIVAAPLLTAPVELERPEGTDSQMSCEPLWTAVSLNYDLITAILEKTDVVDIDDFAGQPNQISPAAAKAVNDLENDLDQQTSQAGLAQRLLEPTLIERMMVGLRSQVPAFSQRIETATLPFRKEDLPRLVEKDGLTWFNHRFAFMGSMPDSLSAYEALNELCVRSKSRS